MPRISGVDIPGEKPTYISLMYLYGIGRTTSIRICRSLGVDLQRAAKELSDDDLARIANLLDKEYVIEGQLRRKIQQDIARLRDIGSYRAVRHPRRLPVRAPPPRTHAP